jgi:sugar phosphate isomerase/epimerase
MVILGTTLFSLTNEWLSGAWTLDSMLRRVADDGLGPGLEVVGFQSFRGFPDLSTEDVAAFREHVDALGLVPSALGVYVDSALRPGHMMGVEEGGNYLQPQLEAAHVLGFPLVRAALGMEPALIERLVPTLERLNLILVLEVQGPTTAESPTLVTTVELLERLQSGAVGLVLDFSLSMAGLPVTFLSRLRRDGMDDDVEAALVAGWHAEGPAHQRSRDFVELARARGAPEAVITRGLTPFMRFGSAEPESFTPMLPWVRHAHAKYWDLEDAERHVVGPHAVFLRLLTDAGYDGHISSEWGGSDWLEVEDASAFELTRRHLGLVRRLLTVAD